jgi:hypothetical protein
MDKPDRPNPPLPPFDAGRLTRMNPAQLRKLHHEVFHQHSQASDSNHLLRKLAWELQARIEGRLPAATLELAFTIARHSVLRTRPVKPDSKADRAKPDGVSPALCDPRLPRPGCCLVRTFRDRHIVVKVLDSGFEFDGRHFLSLSSIAREVTGTRWNGFVFFGLLRPVRHANKTR